ncbi:MAG: hypothetical protein RID09_15200 [Coleofasciculus sp. G1-WW12-02]|uniref:hypothetical protein n=1 Tax=Coleofasciculus sp. G1-WW12-02 TaxID=3068483 RepID=UPI0032F39207
MSLVSMIACWFMVYFSSWENVPTYKLDKEACRQEHRKSDRIQNAVGIQKEFDE